MKAIQMRVHSAMDKFKRTLAEALIKYPKSLLFSLIILSLLAIWPALHIKTNFNLEEFFPKEDPTLKTYQQTAEKFGRDDNRFILAFETVAINDEQILALSAIQQQLDTLQGVTRTLSIWDLQRIQVANNELTTQPILTQKNWQSGINEIIQSTTLSNTLLSNDTKLTAIIIEINQQYNIYTKRKALIQQIEQIASTNHVFKSYFITGIPHFRTQYVDYLNIEIVQYICLGSVLIIALLWFLYGNLRDVILPILIVWLTILFTMAIMVISGGYFEIMSSTIAPILLCVGIGDSIHMLTKYNDGVYYGLDRRESIIEMIRTLGTATLMTSITTAVGFATLMVSNVLPMQRFGFYTAIGVMVAYVVTILFLPSFIWVFKRKHLTIKSESWSEKFMDKGLLRLSDWVQQNYKIITITGFALAILIGMGAFNLRIKSKVFDDVGSDSDLIQNVNKISESLVPPVQIDIILNTGEPEGVFSDQVHEVLADLEAHLQTIPQIKQVRSLGSTLQEIHEALSGDQTPFYANEGQTGQYFFLLELSSAELLKTYVDFEYQTIRLTAFMDDLGSHEVNQVREAILDYTKTKYPDLNITLSGTGILVGDLAYNLVYSLNSSIYLALGIIGLFMFWMFRSPVLSLIALLPNILPLLITAGVMGWLDVALKPSTAVIFTISFGIAVDDTIHFLARYRIEKQRLGNPFTSIFTTILRTGKAIIITSIILMMGFGVLVTSTFESTFLMGLLVCLTILTAVLYDLLVLPSLLAWYFEKYHKEPALVNLQILEA